jgi:glucose/arabinose dehydrogenase
MSSVRLALVTATLAAFAIAGCHNGSADSVESLQATPTDAGAQGPSRQCAPLETRQPNAAEQRPTFPAQTRACKAESQAAFDVAVLAEGLEHPWAVEPLPDGSLLITERPGRMRTVSATGETGPPIAGVPPVDAKDQGGLLDVALGPSFENDRTIYWSYSEPRQGGNATSVARGVLSPDGRRLESVRVIFRAMPTYDGDKHFGSRLAFGRDGMLYVTLGERSDAPMRAQAQQLDSHMGKTIRITPEGKPPDDNPFVDRPNALPEIWTLGHRNVQSAAFDAEGRLWEVEHGTRGGDELNLIEKGKNYGWPIVAFGEEYSGTPIRGAESDRPGYEPPVYYWDPVIAPSGAEFYTGTAFPEWRGSLFIGSLVDTNLVRLVLKNNRVVGEERLLADRRQRIRDVRQGPDGALYIVTDEENGELWKISPRRNTEGEAR